MSDSPTIIVQEDRLRRIVREEMHGAFKNIGIDPEQQLRWQRNMAWLDTWRAAIMSGGMRAVAVSFTILVIGGLAALLTGLGLPSHWLQSFRP